MATTETDRPVATWPMKRGDKFSVRLTWTLDDHDWSGTTVRGQMKRSKGGEVVHEFAFTYDYSTVGVMHVDTELSGDETWAIAAGTYGADFVAGRASPGYGPETPFSVQIVVKDRWTGQAS